MNTKRTNEKKKDGQSERMKEKQKKRMKRRKKDLQEKIARMNPNF